MVYLANRASSLLTSLMLVGLSWGDTQRPCPCPNLWGLPFHHATAPITASTKTWTFRYICLFASLCVSHHLTVRCLEGIFLCLQIHFTHRMQEGTGVLINRRMIYIEEVQVLCGCCGRQAVTLPGFQFLGDKEMGVGGVKIAWILFRGRSALWPFCGGQERAVLIVLPGNESLRCSLWLNLPKFNLTPSSLAPLHSWPEGKINLVIKLNKEMLQVQHFTHCSQSQGTDWSAGFKMSRADSWAWRKV